MYEHYMEMNNNRLKELLHKYLEGTAAEQEIREVDDWYRSFDTHAGLTDQLTASEKDTLEQLLLFRIRAAISEASPARVVRMGARRWVAAASVAVLLGAGGYYIAQHLHTAPQGIDLTETSGRGGIRKISLPDSSVVWLNFDSKVHFTQAGTHAPREVWLEGEGYFEVKPQDNNAFTVHAGKLDVQVLGTSFNVDAYSPSHAVTVTVLNGKVAVGGAGTSRTTLTADQQAIFTAATGSIATRATTAADCSAWTTGEMVFLNVTFQDIATRLERRYSAHIRFADATVANALLRGRFDEHEPLTDVLEKLCAIYGFKYKAEANATYVVYK